MPQHKEFSPQAVVLGLILAVALGAANALPFNFRRFYPQNIGPVGLFFDTHLERAFSIKVFESQAAVREGFGAPPDQETIEP